MRPLSLALVLGLLSASGALAQTKPATRPATSTAITPPGPSGETVQSHIVRLEQAKDLEESVRTQALEACKQALAQLKIARDWQTKAGVFDAAAREAPAKLAAVKKELDTAASQPTTTAPAAATLAELEQLLSKATVELGAANKTIADLASEPKRRADRRLEIAKLAATARQTLGDVEKKLAETPRDRHPELAAAERALLQAQKEAVRQELDAYQKELASYDAERDLLTARGDLAARQVSQAEKRVKQLQAAVDAKRKEEADRAAREADAAAARAHPALREIAGESARLANLRSGPDGLAARIPRVTSRLDDVKAALARLQQDFKSLIEKEKAVGGTATFGVLLRKQRAELPDVRDHRGRMKARQTEVATVQLRLIELQEQRATLADADAAVRRILANLDVSVQPAQRDRIAGAARELLEAQRKNLDELIRDYDTYFGKLIDLDVQVRALVAETEEVADYIGERVLWIRSAPVLGVRDVPVALEACRWLLGPRAWTEVGAALWADASARPVVVGAGVLAFGALLVLRRRLVRRLQLAGEMASKATTGVFGPTALAVVLTALLAVTLPGLIWFVAWRLAAAPAETPAGETAAAGLTIAAASTAASSPVRAVAAGFSTVAAVLFSFGALRQVCRHNGLAEAHFRVAADALPPLRRALLVLALVLGAAGFLISAMEWQGNETWKSSLGRAALIVALGTVTVFAQRLLRSSGPPWAGQANAAGGWLQRLRAVWYLLAIAAPVILAVLAIVGYYYTALHLTGRLAMTFWLVTGLAILNALARRWLAIAFRRLSLRRLRRSRGRQDTADVAAGEPNSKSASGTDDDLGVRLDRIDKQNRQLVRTVVVIVLVLGAWAIWADSLPALAALKRVELWTHTTKVTAQVAAPDGTTLQQTIDKAVPVTLADVGLAVLVAILTVAAVRNIPGLLEVAVLQRIRLDSGARYAMTAILRYTIAVVGVILAFKTIGIGWSSVQWLVAAMTVGLGFGLQEIFANFVSGLIILFERPVRIGDTVTVGETAGTVTRIRIRATTITDWDRKELIVPNKEFVTGRLVNWSLSDKVLRVILRVGIAYGSDTETAEKILYEKAKEHPLVLGDPKPLVLFSAFGDNSLNFELRVYISGIEHYLKVWHDLNMAIDKAFRKAGITIAFPQRDTHLDTLEPLEIRILPADEARKGRAEGTPETNE